MLSADEKLIIVVNGNVQLKSISHLPIKVMAWIFFTETMKGYAEHSVFSKIKERQLQFLKKYHQ